MIVTLKNVRSFCNDHAIPLRPLTLLVGENSTGKSTFLAMLAQLSQPEFPSVRPTFNVPPFDLGTFDSIATFKGGRYGRADSFAVGFETEKRQITATYISYKGQPQLSSYLAKGRLGEVSLDVANEPSSVRVTIKPAGEGPRELNLDTQRVLPTEAGLSVAFLVRIAISESGRLAKDHFDEKMYSLAIDLSRSVVAPVFALAPIRTKPRRTYDEFSDEFKPEGDHIPVLLARLWQEEGNPQKALLVEALDDFGKKSGLFKQIGVKRLGKRPTDPFQILVTTAGPPANLPDVGYGVSQALPVVVQSVLANERRRLLLQQPEVHLHPRAQAALGSFLAKLVAMDKREFVIETHSDYLLDRIRLEVAQRNLRAKDVLILFFEKEGLETHVHQIRIDDDGNVTEAPESYRSFFLQEELTLFNRIKS